jgi:hypothetical protein
MSVVSLYFITGVAVAVIVAMIKTSEIRNKGGYLYATKHRFKV